MQTIPHRQLRHRLIAANRRQGHLRFELTGILLSFLAHRFYSLSSAISELNNLSSFWVPLQPPSKNKQQFKDGVIWANCLELLNTSDVYLVSKDTDFYKDNNIENGLAPNLWEETKQYPYKLTLFSSLNTLLDDIRVDIELDDNNLIKGVFEASEHRINEVLDKAEFSLGYLPVITKSLFWTENSSQLYMKFDIKYECSDQTDQARTNALLGLNGSGLYDKEKEEFLEISLDYVSLEYIDTDGQQQSRGFHYISAHATLGHRTIQHTVRHSLSDS